MDIVKGSNQWVGFGHMGWGGGGGGGPMWKLSISTSKNGVKYIIIIFGNNHWLCIKVGYQIID
jgi:hypothetical protein